MNLSFTFLVLHYVRYQTKVVFNEFITQAVMYPNLACSISACSFSSFKSWKKGPPCLFSG